jgi:hypothetical protein
LGREVIKKGMSTLAFMDIAVTVKRGRLLKSVSREATSNNFEIDYKYFVEKSVAC